MIDITNDLGYKTYQRQMVTMSEPNGITTITLRPLPVDLRKDSLVSLLLLSIFWRVCRG